MKHAPGAVALYSSDLVDQTIYAIVLQLLTKYRAPFERLDSVAVELLTCHYSLAETYYWLTNELPPPDLIEKAHEYRGHRQLAGWFWHRLANHSYRTVQQRPPWSIGEFTTAQHNQIMVSLTRLPFNTAINTWFAVSETWLQICPVSPAWIVQAKQGGCLKIDADIPRCLAAYMEMFTW